jgi:hypothetical protein
MMLGVVVASPDDGSPSPPVGERDEASEGSGPALTPDALIATGKAGRIRLIEKRQRRRQPLRRENEKSHVIAAKAGTH